MRKTQPQLQFFTATTKKAATVKESSQNLNVHGIDDAVASSRLPRPDIRVLKTSFTVACVFLMTWRPVTVVVIMESAENLVPREVSTAVIFLMFTLSSLANPITYGIMNPQLQAAFKRALRFGRCGKNQIN